MPNQIRGLIFDNGDILYDASLWRRWLTEHLQQLGVAITYEELVDTWERKLVDVYRGKAEYWNRFTELLFDFGLDGPQTNALKQRAKKKGAEFQSKRSPMPGVPETLQQLRRQGIKLAVLSDTESGQPGVRKILAQLGIEQLIDVVVASKDIGVVKPDGEAYQAAIDRLELPKTECAFVGHDIDELEGAIAFDLRAIAYNYAAGAPADHYLDHFSDLIDMTAANTPSRES